MVMIEFFCSTIVLTVIKKSTPMLFITTIEGEPKRI